MSATNNNPEHIEIGQTAPHFNKERVRHLVTAMRIRLNRISETSDTNKIWKEAQSSIEALRLLEAEIL